MQEDFVCDPHTRLCLPVQMYVDLYRQDPPAVLQNSGCMQQCDPIPPAFINTQGGCIPFTAEYLDAGGTLPLLSSVSLGKCRPPIVPARPIAMHVPVHTPVAAMAGGGLGLSRPIPEQQNLGLMKRVENFVKNLKLTSTDTLDVMQQVISDAEKGSAMFFETWSKTPKIQRYRAVLLLKENVKFVRTLPDLVETLKKLLVKAIEKSESTNDKDRKTAQTIKQEVDEVVKVLTEWWLLLLSNELVIEKDDFIKLLTNNAREKVIAFRNKKEELSNRLNRSESESHDVTLLNAIQWRSVLAKLSQAVISVQTILRYFPDAQVAANVLMNRYSAMPLIQQMLPEGSIERLAAIFAPPDLVYGVPGTALGTFVSDSWTFFMQKRAVGTITDAILHTVGIARGSMYSVASSLTAATLRVGLNWRQGGSLTALLEFESVHSTSVLLSFSIAWIGVMNVAQRWYNRRWGQRSGMTQLLQQQYQCLPSSSHLLSSLQCKKVTEESKDKNLQTYSTRTTCEDNCNKKERDRNKAELRKKLSQGIKRGRESEEESEEESAQPERKRRRGNRARG